MREELELSHLRDDQGEMLNLCVDMNLSAKWQYCPAFYKLIGLVVTFSSSSDFCFLDFSVLLVLMRLQMLNQRTFRGSCVTPLAHVAEVLVPRGDFKRLIHHPGHSAP